MTIEEENTSPCQPILGYYGMGYSPTCILFQRHMSWLNERCIHMQKLLIVCGIAMHLALL